MLLRLVEALHQIFSVEVRRARTCNELAFAKELNLLQDVAVACPRPSGTCPLPKLLAVARTADVRELKGVAPSIALDLPSSGFTLAGIQQAIALGDDAQLGDAPEIELQVFG